MTPQVLLEKATEVMKNAYAPYSGYFVGAALLSGDGRIFTGCNIENAAYTPTVCAERTAFFSAVSQGVKSFVAIAVVGGKAGNPTGVFPPCGVCRQVMAEFCDPKRFSVYLGKPDGFECYTLQELLPQGFFPHFTGAKQGEKQ